MKALVKYNYEYFTMQLLYKIILESLYGPKFGTTGRGGFRDVEYGVSTYVQGPN